MSIFYLFVTIGYGDLAARLVVSNLHKETSDVFSDVMEVEYRCARIIIVIITTKFSSGNKSWLFLPITCE